MSVGIDKVMGIGLLGLGVVGCGVVKSLQTQQDTIEARTGVRVQVRRVLVRDPGKSRSVDIERSRLTTDASEILSDSGIGVVIEVIGGVEPARALVSLALSAGKHVITANKELLAKHGEELIGLANCHGVRLLFEASVGGGIPIVRMVETYLTANRIVAIRGILNGTCNYILTQMEERGQAFAEALVDAQALGYAEADPESDVEGYDAAYKLCILANLAFPVHSSMSVVRRTGIVAVEPIDLRMSQLFGTSLKLIGQASYRAGSVSLEVVPRFLAASDALSSVQGVFNAVTISADVVGDLTFIGRGAGELPTASAVIEDLVEVLRHPGTSSQAWMERVREGATSEATSEMDVAPEPGRAFYLRFALDDNGRGGQRDEGGGAEGVARRLAEGLESAGGRVWFGSGSDEDDDAGAMILVVEGPQTLLERAVPLAASHGVRLAFSAPFEGVLERLVPLSDPAFVNSSEDAVV